MARVIELPSEVPETALLEELRILIRGIVHLLADGVNGQIIGGDGIEDGLGVGRVTMEPAPVLVALEYDGHPVVHRFDGLVCGRGEYRRSFPGRSAVLGAPAAPEAGKRERTRSSRQTRNGCLLPGWPCHA